MHTSVTILQTAYLYFPHNKQTISNFSWESNDNEALLRGGWVLLSLSTGSVLHLFVEQHTRNNYGEL